MNRTLVQRVGHFLWFTAVPTMLAVACVLMSFSMCAHMGSASAAVLPPVGFSPIQYHRVKVLWGQVHAPRAG